MVSSFFGVWTVSVLVKGISGEGANGSPHLLQNPLSEGFSVWHFGHFISRASFVRVPKEYQFRGKVSNLEFLQEKLFIELIMSYPLVF
jgi:hypothetical protein